LFNQFLQKSNNRISSKQEEEQNEIKRELLSLHNTRNTGLESINEMQGESGTYAFSTDLKAMLAKHRGQ
jgi:hypothetical protein